MFSKWEKHIKMLTVIGAGKGVFATQWSLKELPERQWVNPYYHYFSTDHCEAINWHSITLTLIMPCYDAGMRDKGMGSRWTSKSPHRPHHQRCYKKQNVSNLFLIYGICKIIHYLKLFHPWALSEHWSSLQFTITSFNRTCVHKINTHPSGTERSESPAFDSHVVKKK